MTCIAYAVQIDLCFCDAACENLDVNGSVRAGYLICERSDLFR